MASAAGQAGPPEDHRRRGDEAGAVELGRDRGGVVAVGFDLGQIGVKALGEQQTMQRARFFQRDAGRRLVAGDRERAGEAVAGLDLRRALRDQPGEDLRRSDAVAVDEGLAAGGESVAESIELHQPRASSDVRVTSSGWICETRCGYLIRVVHQWRAISSRSVRSPASVEYPAAGLAAVGAAAMQQAAGEHQHVAGAHHRQADRARLEVVHPLRQTRDPHLALACQAPGRAVADIDREQLAMRAWNHLEQAHRRRHLRQRRPERHRGPGQQVVGIVLVPVETGLVLARRVHPHQAQVAGDLQPVRAGERPLLRRGG